MAKFTHFIRISRVLLGLAALVSGSLAWLSYSGGALPGCGAGACDGVLGSKWSLVLGLPLGLLGAGIYVLLQFKLSECGSLLRRVCSLMIVGAAIWFVSVQAFVLHSFCVWCCAAHSLAVTGVLFSVVAHRGGDRKASDRWLPAAAMAGLALVGLIGIQVGSPDRAGAFVATLESNAVSAGESDGTLSLHGGQFEIDPAEFPQISGGADASAHVVAIVDYTCSHCRKLHASLDRVGDGLGGQLAIVELPGVRSKEGREIQRMMLSLFREMPEKHRQISSKIYSGEISPRATEVYRALLAAFGSKESFLAAVKEHSDWANQKIELTEAILAVNKKKVETDNLPQLMVGDKVLVGAAKDDASYYTAFKETLGLDRSRVARLEFVATEVDLGEVFAGTGREVAFEFKNTGNQAATMKGLRMPQHWRVTLPPPQLLEPGASAMIKFMVPMPLEGGDWEKEVGFVSTAEPGDIPLLLKADVRKLIAVEPPLLEFDATVLEAQTVRITLEEPVSLGQPSTKSPLVTLELRAVKERQEYELVATPVKPLTSNLRLGVIIPIIRDEATSSLWPGALQVPLVVRPQGTAHVEKQATTFQATGAVTPSAES